MGNFFTMITMIFILFAGLVLMLLIRLSRYTPDANRFYPKGRLIVLGHRGYQKSAPENTIGAIKAALTYGADGAEVDIRQTMDSRLVLHHDAGIQTESGDPQMINNTNYSDLLQFQYKKTDGENIPENKLLPLLKDVWTKLPANKRMNLEIKTDGFKCAGFEDRVIKQIQQHGAQANTIISSFNLNVLIKIKAIDGTIQTGLLWNKKVTGFLWFLPIIATFLTNADALHIHFNLAENKIIKACHRLGIKVCVWTINTAEMVEKIRLLNIDGMITDETELIRKTV